MKDQFTIGDKVLITTNDWFVAPDGCTYKAVWGTVVAIETAEETLGVKTNARSTNWYAKIGSMLIAGCQIHYAISTPRVNTGRTLAWGSHEGLIVESASPATIYNADEEYSA